MNKKLQPCNDRVLIKPIIEEEQTYGSLVIPDMGKERPEMGTVIAVGSGRQSEFGNFIKVNVRVGDTVLVPKIGTIRVEFEGDEYYIAQDREILAVIREEDEK